MGSNAAPPDAPEESSGSEASAVGAGPGGSGGRFHDLARPAAATITVIVAIWGAVTGTLAWLQSRDISVDLSAETYSGFFRTTAAGLMSPDEFRVSVINTSSRAVTLTEGDVLVDGQVVGRVSSAGLDQSLNAPTVSLPYSFSSDASSRVRLNWTIGTTASRRLLDAKSKVAITNRDMAIRLKFEPGGVHSVKVRMGQQPLDPGGWKMLMALEADTVETFELLPGTRNVQPALGGLELWRQSGTTWKRILKMREPAAWQNPALFVLPRDLADGDYRFSASADDTLVAVTSLHLPCTAKDGWYGVTACVSGDASAFQPLLPLSAINTSGASATATPDPTP
jgi:hypothetical protein